MSSTSRGTERSPADFYPTPPPPILALLRWVKARPWMAPSLVVDPFAGEGDLLRTVASAGHRVAGLELREECRPKLDAVTGGNAVYGDALAPDCDERMALGFRPKVAGVTNPPFSLARQCIETWAPVFLWSAWLLRLNFYGSRGRRAWLCGPRRPSNVLVLDERTAFIAVCKGLGATSTRARSKGCGRTYPLGTKGRCECGGTIADGADSCEYAWFVFQGRGAVATRTELEILEVGGDD